MADAAEQLKAQRAALLLRVQRAREGRARADAAAAIWDRDAARDEWVDAARRVDSAAAESAARLVAAWNTARATRIGLAELMVLREAEQAERAEATRLGALAGAAHEKMVIAEGTADDASCRAKREASVTARREQIAQHHARRRTCSLTRQEEVSQDEEVAHMSLRS